MKPLDQNQTPFTSFAHVSFLYTFIVFFLNTLTQDNFCLFNVEVIYGDTMGFVEYRRTGEKEEGFVSFYKQSALFIYLFYSYKMNIFIALLSKQSLAADKVQEFTGCYAMKYHV
jgi:hypothetical protein